MITDLKEWMHDNANIFASGADVNSTSLDLVKATHNIGAGQPVKVRAAITVAVTGGTSIAAVLQDSADDSSFADVYVGPTVLVAAALAGKVLLDMVLPEGLRRYIRIAFRNVGANAAGKGDAFLYPGR